MMEALMDIARPSTSPAVSDIAAVVLVAMPDEEAPFLDRATAVGEPVTVGLAEHRYIEIAGRTVLLVRTGIGLVNAAGGATSAILESAPPAGEHGALVISAGTAGGVGEWVRVGDVVVGTEYINADADARAFGYVFGQVPRMPASYSAGASTLEAFARSGHVDDASPSGVHFGLIVSSYSFVTPERALSIRAALPGTLATDMESVAVAQTAYVHGREFVSVRAISDLCGPVAHTDFLTHVDDAAERSAKAVVALLGELPR
jgi:adenosylhomocysteine nucleosidase